MGGYVRILRDITQLVGDLAHVSPKGVSHDVMDSMGYGVARWHTGCID